MSTLTSKKTPIRNTRVLDDSVLTRANTIAKDPKEAKAFLQKAGIITKSGKLTANYR